MGHVDHAEQAEGDRQSQGGEQQDRAQGHATEGLAKEFANEQFAFDLGEAGFGGGAHIRVGFNGRLQ
ncbi:hypothetical protein D3C76_1697090 [compost metagenome]